MTHSINELPLLVVETVLGAALRAAGDKCDGRICLGSQDPLLPLIVARHCSIVMKLQLVPPPLSTAHHLYGSAAAGPTMNDADAAATIIMPRTLRERAITITTIRGASFDTDIAQSFYWPITIDQY